jgi:flagellum-specific peptidoglycan hydrolase FlgJ
VSTAQSWLWYVSRKYIDYTDNSEFIEYVRSCAVHHNSLYEEYERVPVSIVISQAIHESNWGTV